MGDTPELLDSADLAAQEGHCEDPLWGACDHLWEAVKHLAHAKWFLAEHGPSADPVMVRLRDSIWALSITRFQLMSLMGRGAKRGGEEGAA